MNESTGKYDESGEKRSRVVEWIAVTIKMGIVRYAEYSEVGVGFRKVRAS